MSRLGNLIQSSALTGVALTVEDSTRISLQKQADANAANTAAMAKQLEVLTATLLAQTQAIVPTPEVDVAKAVRKTTTTKAVGTAPVE